MARLVILALFINALIVSGGVAATYLLLKQEMGNSASASGESLRPLEYEFFPVEKIIVSLRGDGREHYFVLDLMLLAQVSERPRNFAQVEPIVRNSVVTYLSGFQYNELRSLQVPELQRRLEAALFDDLATKKVLAPFEQVLISKMLVQ